MCDKYCVSQRWNSQHWLVDYQYNFSRFWCFLHFCVTYFQVSCCSPTMGGFFQSRKQWLEHQYHSQHWKTYPKKNNLGSEGMQLVGNMLMRPTRGEPVGPVAKGEKGRGGHWAAFGTRLRLSCLGLHSVDLLIYSKVSIACVGGGSAGVCRPPPAAASMGLPGSSCCWAPTLLVGHPPPPRQECSRAATASTACRHGTSGRPATLPGGGENHPQKSGGKPALHCSVETISKYQR